MLVNDQLYGEIRLSPLCAAFERHPLFQRLKRVHQMGSGILVFPQATHTRHEHSLGVMHLAGVLARHLGATPHETDAVELAGLCHDVGHGPYSHVYDRFSDPPWSHEERSKELLRVMHDELDVPARYDADFIALVAYLIEPEGPIPACIAARPFLAQIVNNVHIVDVDKMDYLQRDHLVLRGERLDVDVLGMLRRCSVVDRDIAFAIEDEASVTALLRTRTEMHLQFYCHVLVEGTGIMLGELVRLHLARAAPPSHDLRDFSLHVSQYTDIALLEDSEQTEGELSQLAHRVRTPAEWYKHVVDTCIPPEPREDHIIVPWDVHVSKHAPHNALPRIPFHESGQRCSARCAPPPPPHATMLYRVFQRN